MGDCINKFKIVTISTDMLMLKVEILTDKEIKAGRRTGCWEKETLPGMKSFIGRPTVAGHA